MKNMDIEFKIAELKLQILELEKEFKEVRANVPTAFEVGKWYTGKTAPGSASPIWIVNYQKDKHCFGITYEDIWRNDLECTSIESSQTARPATDSEVEKALLTEADKRGFKVGVTVNNRNLLYAWNKKIEADGPESYYHSSDDRLVFKGAYIYKQGQWATILPDEVRIAGEKVEYGEHTIMVAGYPFSREQLNQTKSTLGLPKVSGIEVTKCSGEKVIVTASEIDKILKAWK